MITVKPFRGVRPQPNLVEQIAAPPYDVLNSEEAREMARENPYSFLHINKPEIDLNPGIDPYDERVYRKGAENFRRFLSEGIIFQDKTPCFYVYRQIMGDHRQTGLVAAASVEDYQADRIKKHELTRPDKEDDRLKHISYQNAQVGPVFLTYKAVPEIDQIIDEIVRNQPVYDFHGAEDVQHTLWVVDNPEIIARVEAAFKKLNALYVADGHHRSAAATRLKMQRQAENPHHTGNEPYNYFLSVIFPHNQMKILDYNRVVKDLNGLNQSGFLEILEQNFVLEKRGTEPFKPAQTHEFGMYLDKNWYQLTAKPHLTENPDPVKRLDVSILQENVLSPILGITNPRKDARIDFIGGIRGLSALQERVDSGQWQVAFALYPTSIEDLMKIADAGKTMPPKSTWFEPKLKSGLVVHLLDE